MHRVVHPLSYGVYNVWKCSVLGCQKCSPLSPDIVLSNRNIRLVRESQYFQECQLVKNKIQLALGLKFMKVFLILFKFCNSTLDGPISYYGVNLNRNQFIL